jgi:hypothetical protein
MRKVIFFLSAETIASLVIYQHNGCEVPSASLTHLGLFALRCGMCTENILVMLHSRKVRYILKYSGIQTTKYVACSDYLAELAALPQSGIADIESSIPLPGHYNTTADSVEEEQSSLYFLACLSMRRLLNRVHDLLYARDSGAGLDVARFPFIVTELDHQLEEWRELLPPTFKFSIDTQPTTTQHGGFLRQRYLTCRSVIYRPYLTWILANRTWNGSISMDVLEKCGVCLNACVLHILNLKGYCHTVMIDTWICSLS